MTDETKTETTPEGREVTEGVKYVGAGRELRILRIKREEGKYPRYVIQGQPRLGPTNWSRARAVTGATLDNELTGMKPEDEIRP